jgi:hypothetical protein
MGTALKDIYKREGFRHMLPKHAQFADGSYGVEPGILEMCQRMESGRFKLAKSLTDWWSVGVTITATNKGRLKASEMTS